jgi:hypothetical protein
MQYEYPMVWGVAMEPEGYIFATVSIDSVCRIFDVRRYTHRNNQFYYVTISSSIRHPFRCCSARDSDND